MGNKRKAKAEEQAKASNEVEFNLSKKHMNIKLAEDKRLIVILYGAQLETIKIGNEFQLLNCDDHMNLIRKYNRNPGNCRPDITHQSLLMLFDSPLNRAGLLQVYIRTEQNVLIEINPQTRIPRTFKRFAGLIVQLLHKMNVRAADSTLKLMKVIKNPVTNHLPVGCKKYVMSFNGELVKSPRTLVPTIDQPIVLLVGAFAHGNIQVDFADNSFSISNYPLSAALVCSKLCNAFEEVWGIV